MEDLRRRSEAPDDFRLHASRRQGRFFRPGGAQIPVERHQRYTALSRKPVLEVENSANGSSNRTSASPAKREPPASASSAWLSRKREESAPSSGRGTVATSPEQAGTANRTATSRSYRTSCSLDGRFADGSVRTTSSRHRSARMCRRQLPFESLITGEAIVWSEQCPIKCQNVHLLSTLVMPSLPAKQGPVRGFAQTDLEPPKRALRHACGSRIPLECQPDVTSPSLSCALKPAFRHLPPATPELVQCLRLTRSDERSGGESEPGLCAVDPYVSHRPENVPDIQ